MLFLPALMQGVFPSDRVTDNWVTNPAVLPAELRGDAGAIPQLADATNAGMRTYKNALHEQQLLAEDRLAYVGATRAKRLLVGSGHYWRAELANPRQPSEYLRTIMAAAQEQDRLVPVVAEPGGVNPLVTQATAQPRPAPLDPDVAGRRAEAAAAVEAARIRWRDSGGRRPEELGAPLGRRGDRGGLGRRPGSTAGRAAGVIWLGPATGAPPASRSVGLARCCRLAR